MARINPVEISEACPQARTLLDGIRKSMGVTPLMMRALATSPATLKAYLGFGQALAGGTLGGRLREQIALAVAGTNACGYCASAHTALGQGQGVDDDELARNLQATSDDPRTAAALGFARALVVKRGFVSDDDVQAVRGGGFSEGDVTEIIGVVALNIFTNYFNHVAQTEIDFPPVEVGELVTS